MKKVGWIVAVVLAVWTVFLLVKKPEPGAGSVDLTSAVSTQTQSPASSPPVFAGKNQVAVRIPLPEPVCLELNAGLVPMHLHPLFGWKDIGGYVPRRRFVEALGDTLSADEVAALILFARRKPEDVGLSESDFNGVGDVVLLKLEEQKKLPVDYTDHLVVMFYDESLNPQWRDYCIQHLGTVYPRTAEEKRPVIRQLYNDALASGSAFAGTTLLSMKRSAGTPDLSRDVVAEKAMIVALSDAFSDAERLSALAVAAEFNHPDALDLAREVAVSKRAATFRMASLAVIGRHGDITDQPLLEKYSKSSDIRLRTAATQALQNLNHE
jgi:hypothetical protein